MISDYVVINNGPKKFTDTTNTIRVLDYTKIANEFRNRCISHNKLTRRKDKSIFGSAHHAFTIDTYIYNSNADYILLFDTDVILTDNFDDKLQFLIQSRQPLYSCLTPEDISRQHTIKNSTTLLFYKSTIIY